MVGLILRRQSAWKMSGNFTVCKRNQRLRAAGSGGGQGRPWFCRGRQGQVLARKLMGSQESYGERGLVKIIINPRVKKRLAIGVELKLNFR